MSSQIRPQRIRHFRKRYIPLRQVDHTREEPRILPTQTTFSKSISAHTTKLEAEMRIAFHQINQPITTIKDLQFTETKNGMNISHTAMRNQTNDYS